MNQCLVPVALGLQQYVQTQLETDRLVKIVVVLVHGRDRGSQSEILGIVIVSVGIFSKFSVDSRYRNSLDMVDHPDRCRDEMSQKFKTIEIVLIRREGPQKIAH